MRITNLLPWPRDHGTLRNLSYAGVAATLLACGDGVTGPSRPAVEQEGLRYAAELVEAGPELVIGRVNVANRSGGPRTVRFPDRCVALLRFYFPDGRLVWDQLEGNKTCGEPAVELALAPGEERTFQRFAHASVVLVYLRRPSGVYRVTLYLRPVGEPIVELPLGTIELERLEAMGQG